MCDWSSKHLQQEGDLSTSVKYDGSGNLTISGHVRNPEPDAFIVFWAANPPDYRTSYSGSGLPFHNYESAYENTPNRGTVGISASGDFRFSIRYPSGYYTGLGTVYMQPHVFMQVHSKNYRGKPLILKVGEGVPFRLLTYPPIPVTAPRCSPNFYAGRDTQPVRTQEQILRDSAYPATNNMPKNFWGLTPPH